MAMANSDNHLPAANMDPPPAKKRAVEEPRGKSDAVAPSIEPPNSHPAFLVASSRILQCPPSKAQHGPAHCLARRGGPGGPGPPPLRRERLSTAVATCRTQFSAGDRSRARPRPAHLPGGLLRRGGGGRVSDPGVLPRRGNPSRGGDLPPPRHAESRSLPRATARTSDRPLPSRPAPAPPPRPDAGPPRVPKSFHRFFPLLVPKRQTPASAPRPSFVSSLASAPESDARSFSRATSAATVGRWPRWRAGEVRAFGAPLSPMTQR